MNVEWLQIESNLDFWLPDGYHGYDYYDHDDERSAGNTGNIL
jgi:hypothetical protein